MTTETLDRLYLEYSNITTARTGRELALMRDRRELLIKFITWVRNHYAVNAVIDNKGMVDFYLEQEKS